MAAALFHYLENPQLCCRKLTQFGGYVSQWGAVDGDMFVCLDEGRAPPPGDCLFYSAGVSSEWSFGRAGIRYGCRVYAFDPSTTAHKQNEADFGARFHRIGLGGRTEMTKDGWHMMTLTDLRAKLGHSRRTIDYLAVNTEGSEWDWLENDVAGLEGVRQLGMQVHMQVDMQALRRYYDAFWRIQEAGFKTIHSNPYRAYGRNSRMKGVDGMVATVYRLVWMRSA
ncbi:uncharacterized protein LOC119096040 [Pollicipes pollicipes]|uniref:uncharacterized protein LOC119096040 n=1 Tax=Pollicipes pollicipes TaxID=41117 RepID=UPI001884E923|nr:uncharacterized protein LOC119096040 [Pollicipes pollicipes]